MAWGFVLCGLLLFVVSVFVCLLFVVVCFGSRGSLYCSLVISSNILSVDLSFVC